MSNLRKHLDKARSDYRSTRYPGDLAAELLGESDAIPITRARPMMMRIVGWSATISAVAAAIVLWVTLRPATQAPSTPSTPKTMVASTAPTEETVTVAEADEEEDVIEVQTVAEMGSVPAFPQDVSFAPSATEMSIPSSFTFPSMEMDFTQDSTESDTKESA